MNDVNGATKRATNSFKAFNAAIGLVSASALVALGRQSVLTAAKYDALNKAIEFSSGSALHAAMNMQFLTDTSDDLKLNLESLKVGYKTFSGAMRGSIFTQRQQRDMFLKISKAAKVMQLDSENTKGVFLALGQIMSKGKVQAEELRGQIGERIPGAFQIAAKAMGVTSAELNKMMEQGKLIASDFLPKFADQLEKDFAGGVEKATDSISSQLNMLENAWNTTLENMGKAIASSGVIEKVAELLQGFNQFGDKGKFIIDKVTKGDLKIAGRDVTGEEETLFALAEFQQLQKIKSELEKLQETYDKLDGTQKAFFSLKKLDEYQSKLVKLEEEYDILRDIVKDEKDPDLRKLRTQIAFLRGLRGNVFKIDKEVAGDEEKALEGVAKAKADLATTITARSPKTININVEKQIGVENLNTTNINESYQQVGESIERVLNQALAQAEQVAQ
jgi:tape measure domain-containing protein